MRSFPQTPAVRQALQVVTDPAFASEGGPMLRRLAWMTLMETRGRAARQSRIRLFRRPAGGGAA